MSSLERKRSKSREFFGGIANPGAVIYGPEVGVHMERARDNDNQHI
jgi:hypothetical protein